MPSSVSYKLARRSAPRQAPKHQLPSKSHCPSPPNDINFLRSKKNKHPPKSSSATLLISQIQYSELPHRHSLNHIPFCTTTGCEESSDTAWFIHSLLLSLALYCLLLAISCQRISILKYLLWSCLAYSFRLPTYKHQGEKTYTLFGVMTNL